MGMRWKFIRALSYLDFRWKFRENTLRNDGHRFKIEVPIQSNNGLNINASLDRENLLSLDSPWNSKENFLHWEWKSAENKEKSLCENNWNFLGNLLVEAIFCIIVWTDRTNILTKMTFTSEQQSNQQEIPQIHFYANVLAWMRKTRKNFGIVTMCEFAKNHTGKKFPLLKGVRRWL